MWTTRALVILCAFAWQGDCAKPAVGPGNPTKFETCSKKAELVQEHKNWGRNKDPLPTRLNPNKDFYSEYSKILKSMEFNNNVKESPNGLIWTVVAAYNNHHNLILRPDDIWLGILTQFSFYMNANAEKYRDKFVNFQGKKELEVGIVGTLDNAPYDLFVELMTKQIHKNLIDKKVKNWVIPDFTTSTRDDKLTAGVILMATMKEYFNYNLNLLCGIPSVTLLGTVDDWKKIKQKLKKLKSYDLSKWVKMLEPIVENFIKAKQGKVDKDFWQKICDYRAEGSGPSYVSGWITAFSVFDKNGTWQGNPMKGSPWPKIDIDNITSGIVEVDVTIKDAEKIYKSVMFAGHVGGEVLKDGYTLQPKSGWAIALKIGQE